jgi:hypothetical protein
MRATFIAVMVLVFHGVVACGRPAQTFHPRSTLERYVHFVRANQPRGAYGLLSKKVREVQSYEAFERSWKKHYADLQAQAEEVAAKLGKDKAFTLAATARIGGLREVGLVYEGKRWRVDSGVSVGFSASSPRDAVLALVRAVEARNLNAFMKTLTKQRREGLNREITQRLEKIRANLDRAFEVTGNRARLQYDPKYWIMLVKENGVWRVLEFN